MKFAACCGSGRGRGTRNEDGILEFKSKNLDAERRRRGKLKQRINDLRAAVPNITNMTKAATLDDAITYINGLKQQVDGLTNCLEQMEDTTVPQAAEEEETEVQVEMDDQNIEKFNIDEEVKVTYLEENKFCIKIICYSKRGIFTRLMELMSSLGFEIMDNNFTSFKGVCLTTLSVKGSQVDVTELEKLEEYLLQAVTS
ncbi:transcription factor DYT1-like [Papaver somniferum]|uniref:transcription factor DYT1-like n=1 Tax=Papaver somniferum TaxID=3469 RepID=UPI000E6FEF9A|nr:transcription factor DYT1-like [Papaver somniferum]